MKRTALFCGLLLAASVTAASAQDGVSLSVGADYSTGEYGSDTTTEIFSVPVTAKWTSDRWTWKASLPWLRVDGDPNVLPGLGGIGNGNPRGRGRGGSVIPTPEEPVVESGTASGLGDLRLSAAYALDTDGPLGIDLTAQVKVPTADEDKGLGTGEFDYGLGVDLYRSFDGTLVFGGAGYTVLGDNAYLQLDNVANANFGFSRALGGGSAGLMYDWRQAASDTADDRSELTGFYSVKTGGDNKVQVYATAGLSDGSPDWGAGISFTNGF